MKEGLLFTNCIGFNTFYQMFQLSMLLSYLLCSSLLSSSFASYVVNLQMPKPKKTENKELLGTFCAILSCSRTKVKSENKFPQKIAKSSYLIEHIIRHPTMYQGKSPVHKLYWFQYILLVRCLSILCCGHLCCCQVFQVYHL